MINNRHKILYMVTSTRRMGGTERLFDNCINSRKCFDTVAFCSLFPPFNAQLRSFYNNNGVVFLALRRWPYLLKILLQYPIILFKLTHIIKVNEINIVHVHDNLGMLFAVSAKLFANIKVIRTFHAAVDNYFQLEHICYRLLRRSISKTIFVSESFMKLYAKINRTGLGELRGRVIYNGLEFNKFEPKNESKNSTNEYRLIMVGNYSGGRDHLFVTKVFHEILNSYVNTSLWLIGNIASGRKSKNRYSNCIDYTRNEKLSNKIEFIQNISDVTSYLLESDVFIYESTRDTFGMAIVEAMFCGLPCIINDLDVFQEISNQGEFAVLFKTGDIGDCVEKTLSVLNNYEYHKEKAMNNISIVKDKYSMERYAKNLMEIYREVAEGM